MPPKAEPIPALYVVYVLRSTQRRQSFYIGSTPNPPRRLRQHNGEVKGGAKRTGRMNLRPWEMAALVSGFPGQVAALKFEWALDHPELTSHIASEDRVSKRAAGSVRRRLPKPMPSILANLDLLLRAPSFSRWPLKLHLFSSDMHVAWEALTPSPAPMSQLRTKIPVIVDFGPSAPLETSSSLATVPTSPTEPTNVEPPSQTSPSKSSKSPSKQTTTPSWGIHALPLDYDPIRAYVSKAHEIFAFERAETCAVCHEPIPPDAGLYVVCSRDACEAVGHLTCWGRHFLNAEEVTAGPGGAMAGLDGRSDEAWATRQVIPVRGPCPSCGDEVKWEDMMKELTLRTRAHRKVRRLVSGLREPTRKL